MGFEKEGAQPAGYEELASKTRVAFADVDASPTKAYMILHRDEPKVRPLFKRAFGKRPARELFDLRSDPWQMHNVAGEEAYAEIAEQMENRLMAELKATGDPRALGHGEVFDVIEE
jgi:uncharacterized sulfatase